MFRRAKAHGGSRNRSSSPWKLPHDSMKITRSSNIKNLKVTWHKSLSCSCQLQRNFWFSSCPNYDLKCVCKPEGRCIVASLNFPFKKRAWQKKLRNESCPEVEDVTCSGLVVCISCILFSYPVIVVPEPIYPFKLVLYWRQLMATLLVARE